MTTRYLVAYPHPSILPEERIQRLKVEPKSDGGDILEALCIAYPQYSDDLNRATLWKAPGVPTSVVDNESKVPAYEWIAQRIFPEIDQCEPLEMYFPDGPQEPSGNWVDIMVVTPEILEDMDYQGDDSNLRRMEAREALSRTMRTTSSPSESVESSSLIKRVMENPAGPRYGRPSNRFGPPTALFSEELAILRYDLVHLEGFPPNPVGVNRAFMLVENAANFFDDENERKSALRPILAALLAGRCQWQQPTTDGSATPDGLWLQGPFAYLIVEVKNEPGLGGDPFLQGAVAYTKILAQDKYLPFLKRSNLPVVLLAIAGNCLVVSTAIFTDSVYVDKLVSIDLQFGPHASDNVLRLARTFMAINKCTGLLRRMYIKLNTTVRTFPPANFMWPNPTVYPSKFARRVPELEFFAKVDPVLGTPIDQALIDEDNKRHAIYLARMRTKGGTVEVLVKFTARYNAFAHWLLADHDPPLAPALYSSELVIGDMFMVVMEYIPTSEGTSLINLSPPPPALDVIYRDVSHALGVLHGMGLVFGDLRESNVLYLPMEGRALLINFEAADEERKGRYSACLDPRAGLGVDRMQMMEKCHDVENLGRLMNRISRGL